MKLHDLRPADGSRTARTRVGRGIAAGKGKTAGRGTKGQKARAGGSIPPWFEGGQTPLHMRIPKLRGFTNRFKIEYEVVNIGRIGEAASLGAFDVADAPSGGKSAKAGPATVNQEILRAVGLVRRLDRPMKVLGHGDIDVALFVVADSFSKSAVAKIEAAGGSVQVLEVPTAPLAALGVDSGATGGKPTRGRSKAAETKAHAASAVEAVEAEPVAAVEPPAPTEAVDAVAEAPTAGKAAPAAKAAKAPSAKKAAPAAKTAKAAPPARAAAAAKAKPVKVAKAKATTKVTAEAASAAVDETAAAATATDDAPASKDA